MQFRSEQMVQCILDKDTNDMFWFPDDIVPCNREYTEEIRNRSNFFVSKILSLSPTLLIHELNATYPYARLRYQMVSKVLPCIFAITLSVVNMQLKQ